MAPSILPFSSSFIPKLAYPSSSQSPIYGAFNFRTSQDRPLTVTMASSPGSNGKEKSTKLVTFLGKGGSGKTTSAIFAAQHFAKIGLKTCLLIHSQDSTAEHLLDCKIGTNVVSCEDNLSAVRLETTKMILEPLKRLKEADARLNLTQGVLEGVVGEELGVLPGMDSIFSLLTLEKFINFTGNKSLRNRETEEYDIVVYDGSSCEETLRMIGASSKARLYLRYLRNMAEKTDFGRLAGPSLMRLVDDTMNFTETRSQLNGNTSAKIWDALEEMLTKGSSAFLEPNRFGCFIVMDPPNPSSVKSALRYWGSTIQAGAFVSGALAIASQNPTSESIEEIKNTFFPLPFAFIPQVPFTSPPNWDAILSRSASEQAQVLLSSSSLHNSMMKPVRFDSVAKSVTLLMPGFDKSEIKLYQYRGGSELLVEAGDQRRVIRLPSDIQGKVAGAKFLDRSLVITMR